MYRLCIFSSKYSLLAEEVFFSNNSKKQTNQNKKNKQKNKQTNKSLKPVLQSDHLDHQSHIFKVMSVGGKWNTCSQTKTRRKYYDYLLSERIIRLKLLLSPGMKGISNLCEVTSEARKWIKPGQDRYSNYTCSQRTITDATGPQHAYVFVDLMCEWPHNWAVAENMFQLLFQDVSPHFMGCIFILGKVRKSGIHSVGIRRVLIISLHI